MKPPPTQPPRVLWVDDDPSIRRLVALALEDEAIDLVLCASVAQARAALAHPVEPAQGPVALLVTDLMMPGENGFDLLDSLAGAARPRTVVFSARLDEDTQARLAALGVWRHLVKPAPVAALVACVRDGLEIHRVTGPDRLGGVNGADDADGAVGAGGADGAGATDAADGAGNPTAAAPEPQRRAQVLARNFGGDQQLFDAFEAACHDQFVHDLLAGDKATATDEGMPSLRLLGHSLKSVLRSLGHDAPAAHAQALEQAGDRPAALQAWAALRQALVIIRL